MLRERGQREVFCGLTGIIWLHRKIQDAFFLVVGSRTCAHLIQSAAGVMIFAEPRFATAIIDERDLAGLADATTNSTASSTRLLERRPDIKLLFLVGSCPSEVIKLDLSRAAAAACRRSSSPGVRVLNYSGSGIETTFTQGEDACLAVARAGACRRRRRRRRQHCWSWARWPMSSRISSRACSRNSALPTCASCPPRRAADLPPVGPNTQFLLAQPFLADTARALEERGARVLPRLFPLGAEGTTLGCKPQPSAWRRRRGALRRRRCAWPRARRAARWRASSLRWQASASSSSPTRSSKFRWRASCRANCGMQLIEVGTPYLHRRISPRNSTLLPATALRRAKARTSTSSSIAAAPRKPDLVVCGLGLANPLEAEGLTTKWSIELVFTPVQGYDQAADLAELFARPLVRRATAGGLAMQLTLWTYEGPPHVGAMRIATAMEGVHYVLHAPQGDTYADLLFTMIERRDKRPPVTYTTFQARDLGSDTARAVQDRRARRL